MAFEFNILEVFEIAEEIERNGAAFYRNVVADCGTAQARRALLQLAERGTEHADAFAAIARELIDRGLSATAFDPDHEDVLYLKAMADRHVFDVHTDPSAKLTGEESQEEILKSAVYLEKEGLAYYLGLKDALQSRTEQDKVEIIIKAKMRNIGLLNRELAAGRQRPE